jgi:putative ABC transport system ATP-binding protein
VIELRDVRKVYLLGEVEVHALRGVDLRIEDGEKVAIMGPSGCGKSTMMNLIGLLDTPSSGSITLDGREVSELGEDELAAARNARIGFVFQTFQLLPRVSALRQVMLPLQYARRRRNGRGLGARVPRAEREARARQALIDVGLGDRMAHDPSELSGGQRQRVAIARALVNAPSIVLADEPTGNLDSVSGAEILKLFDALHVERGITFVTVTHDEAIAERATRILRMFDGRIVADERA